MRDNLLRCIDLILASEGGYSNNPKDPGGPTNMGVTLSTLQAWRGHAITAADVQALDKQEAEDIYSAQYAAKVSFGVLPAGVDYAVLDTAVNSGPSRAAKLLQQVVGVDQDGVIGAKTLFAVGEMDAALAVERYSDARLAFMQSLKTWGDFGKGWKSRVDQVEHDALGMVQGAPIAQRPAILDGAQAKASGAVKMTATQSGKAALATLGAVVATAGTAATQASGVLSPYADISAVRYVLLGLAVVSATSAFVVASQRASSGATT